MRAAIVLDGIVVNIIEVESMASFTPAEGTLVQDDGEASIGGHYISGKFYPYRLSNAEQTQNRLEAYQNKTDPIFFLMQRGEATEEAWQAAIQSVKDQYPYYYDDEGNLIEAQ